MAENIWNMDTQEPLDIRILELVAECERQFESCLFTSTSLFIWQKRARMWRKVFIVAPIILGGIASSSILAKVAELWAQIATAMTALLAGFFPAIYDSLQMDMELENITRSAAEYKNLQDRFRQAAKIKKFSTFEEFRTEFEVLMDRMDAIRGSAPAVPDWCFKDAQKQIGKGTYDFAVDTKKSGGVSV